MPKFIKVTLIALLLVATLAVSIFYLMNADIAMFHPMGMIAEKERDLMVTSIALMLIVVIPVFFLTLYICWKYRAAKQSEYKPEWDGSRLAESLWWGLPCLIILALGILVWKSTHDLNPYKPLVSDVKPLRIQAVALRWKWLFIYPELGIATVNFVEFPSQTPLNWEITADAPMNSFWIPQLGGQIYAMPGMRTKLHLIANQTGTFRGSSSNLSGRGFSGMNFPAKAVVEEEFLNWVQSVKQTAKSLTSEEYNRLVKPTVDEPAAFYLLENPDFFEGIIMKYMMPPRMEHE